MKLRDKQAHVVSYAPPVTVDHHACEKLAKLIGAHNIPPDREEYNLPALPRSLIGNFYLPLVAICHQTTPLGREPLEGFTDGILRRGWDFLLARFQEAVTRDANLLEPRRWARITGNEVCEMFTDSRVGERLTHPASRAELLRDLGENMLSSGWSRADDIYMFCRRQIARDQPNLLDTLAKFRAYADPVRKKSLFFLALMRNSGCWTYEDEENLGPPVDYHEVRGHLRIGTVVVDDADLQRRLLDSKPVSAEQDVALRQAVYDAIMLISELSGLRNPSQLHYLFWNIFRSVCTREEPHCLEIRKSCSLSERYTHLTVHTDGSRQCPFSSVCPSATASIRYKEHVFETNYY